MCNILFGKFFCYMCGKMFCYMSEKIFFSPFFVCLENCLVYVRKKKSGNGVGEGGRILITKKNLASPKIKYVLPPLNANSCRVSLNSCMMTFLGSFQKQIKPSKDKNFTRYADQIAKIT